MKVGTFRTHISDKQFFVPYRNEVIGSNLIEENKLCPFLLISTSTGFDYILFLDRERPNRLALNTVDKLNRSMLSEPEARDEAAKIPGFGHMIGYNYKQDTYVVHKSDTKEVITAAKKLLESSGIFLTGRFTEWEYYNMDTAINSALVTSSQIINYL
jgi:hypothetical protein